MITNSGFQSRRVNFPQRGGHSPMMGMMMQLMQLMMGILTGGACLPQSRPGGCGFCPMSNPGFGGANFGGGPSGSPLGGFLGDGGQTPMNQSFGQAPFAGTGGGDLAARLPGALQPLAGHFEAAGQKYNVDPKFLAAISMLETASGTSNAFRNKRNAMGVSNASGPISFAHPAESIERMARVLASSTGPYKNANTIAGIGRIYAPPGAGNDVHGTNGYWATGVSKFYQQLGGNPSAVVLQRV